MSTPHGFIFEEDLQAYKKEHISYFRSALNDDSLSAEDISDNIVKGIELSDFIGNDLEE